MDSDPKNPNEANLDAFIGDESTDSQRLSALTEIRRSHRARTQLVTQHFSHGLLASKLDAESGATKRRTNVALAQLKPVRSISPRIWASAAAIILVLGAAAILLLNAQKTPEARPLTPIVEHDATPPSLHDAGISRIDAASETLQRTRDGKGQRLHNTGATPAVVHFENGGIVTLDALSSLVVVDAGNRIRDLQGRIGMELQGVRVSMSETDALLMGAPAVAVFEEGYLNVFSGSAQATDGHNLASAGQRLELATREATAFDAGKLPEFITQGRVSEVLSALQSRVDASVVLEPKVWEPMLTVLLREPVGRELAKQSVDDLLGNGVTEAEFTDFMEATNMVIEFAFSVHGEEKALVMVREGIERWKSAPPEMRAAQSAMARKMLEGWRAKSEAEREQFRKMMRNGFKRGD